MQKFVIIEEFCTELLYSPVVPSQETINNLSIAARMIQDDIGCNGDDWYELNPVDATNFIREWVGLCSVEIQESVYFLLLESAGMMVH